MSILPPFLALVNERFSSEPPLSPDFLLKILSGSEEKLSSANPILITTGRFVARGVDRGEGGAVGRRVGFLVGDGLGGNVSSPSVSIKVIGIGVGRRNPSVGDEVLFLPA